MERGVKYRETEVNETSLTLLRELELGDTNCVGSPTTYPLDVPPDSM